MEKKCNTCGRNTIKQLDNRTMKEVGSPSPECYLCSACLKHEDWCICKD